MVNGTPIVYFPPKAPGEPGAVCGPAAPRYAMRLASGELGPVRDTLEEAIGDAMASGDPFVSLVLIE